MTAAGAELPFDTEGDLAPADADEIARLHDAVWEPASALPRPGPELDAMAAIDHPVARCLSVLYAQRGGAEARFGIDHRGPDVAELARQVLREPARDRHTRPDRVPTESHWYALMVLQEVATEADAPLVVPVLEAGDESLRDVALHVVVELAARCPGAFERSGAAPLVRAMAEREPDLGLRCRALHGLARHAFDDGDTERLVRRHAAGGEPGELAWTAMVALLERDRAGSLAAAIALEARSPREGWHHWLEELRSELDRA